MPLNGGSIPLGATYTPVGGTATSLSRLKNGDSSTKLLIVDAATFSLRSTIDASVVEPVANSTLPGGYSPRKMRISRKKPITLADGTVYTNQVNIEIIAHPETTSVQMAELRSTGINVLNDTDFDNFYNTGSLE